MSRKMPLHMVSAGEQVTIVELKGGHNVVGKLHDLGIYPGVKVTILNSLGHGPTMISLNGTRLGIGIGMAYKIIVSPVESAKVEIPGAL